MMKLILSLALLAWLPARAVECLPGIDNAGWWAGDSCSTVTKNGQAVQWYCVEKADGTIYSNVTEFPLPKVRRIRYVGLPSVLSKLGSRLATIVGSSDPLASLNAAPSRFSIIAASDPRFAAVVTELEAKCGK